MLHPGIMHPLLRSFLLTCSLLAGHCSFAQQEMPPDYVFFGKWANKDTAIVINADGILAMYKEQSGWVAPTSQQGQFSFIKTGPDQHHTEKELKCWTASSFTSLRLYLTDGTE